MKAMYEKNSIDAGDTFNTYNRKLINTELFTMLVHQEILIQYILTARGLEKW